MDKMDSNGNISIYIPFGIHNTYIISSYNWYNNMGTIDKYPHYILEHKDGKIKNKIMKNI